MKKNLLFFLTFVYALLGYTQTCPTPTTSGVHITLDSTYKIGTYRSGKTSVGMCFYNSTSEKITAAQFRVFYDKSAFASVDTHFVFNLIFGLFVKIGRAHV